MAERPVSPEQGIQSSERCHWAWWCGAALPGQTRIFWKDAKDLLEVTKMNELVITRMEDPED
jgi:hypothetical protein